MSDKFSGFTAISMNDLTDSITQDGEEARPALQNRSADRILVGLDDCSTEVSDASTSQIYLGDWIKFEELLQSLHTSVAHLENFAKSEKVAKIDKTTADDEQIANSKNTAELIHKNGTCIDCRDLQKEMVLLKAELSAKDEKVKTLETMLEFHQNGISTMSEAPINEEKRHLMIESEHNSLRTELIECRSRESRLLQDYIELKNENISLRKQVSMLEYLENGIPIAPEAPDCEKKMKVTDLQEHLIRLEAELSLGREEIAALSTLLESNKNTVEVELCNFDNAKVIFDIINNMMLGLRNVQKTLKESAAKF